MSRLLAMLFGPVVGCGAAAPNVDDRVLALHGGWTEENRARLLELIGTRGRRGAAYDPAHPPAVFDGAAPRCGHLSKDELGG